MGVAAILTVMHGGWVIDMRVLSLPVCLTQDIRPKCARMVHGTQRQHTYDTHVG